LAVVLVGAVFIGWQTYMQKKYPQAFQPKDKIAATSDVKTDDVAAQKPSASAQITNGATHKTAPPEISQSPLPPETRVAYKSENLAFEISSRGMGLANLQLLKYHDRQNQIVQFGVQEGKTLPYETRLLGRKEALHFAIERVNDQTFVGHAQVGSLRVTKFMEVDPVRYTIQYRVAVSGQDDRFVGLSTALVDTLDPVQSSSFLMPHFEQQQFFVNGVENKERVTLGHENLQKSWPRVHVASLGSQYFAQAIVDQSAIIPEGKGDLNATDNEANLWLQYPVLNLNNLEEFKLEYLGFVGPKSYQLLRSIDPQLAEIVDFGFFSWIARHILQVLRWFYELTGNWGMAIVFLTLLVRLVVLPANIFSYKSMRAMQAIQPQIQAARERLKDNQAEQQQEIMRLMRENKVNPLGGCLPVLLQFPIFIALYQMLGHSVELYQAPFGLWIHDLSLKDPFYILPVLMGLTMFIQQKITPTTMDPAQAKVLMFMPIVFTFFMVSVPSGLTLYMVVGAIFSVIQQLYFMKTSPVEVRS